MTARAKRGTLPLSAPAAVGRIRAIYADQERRIAELKEADHEKARAIVDRVEGARESDALALMLDALGIFIPGVEVSMAVPSDDDDPTAGDTASTNDVPSRPTLEEYAEPSELPAGARDYVPSPLAQSARRGR